MNLMGQFEREGAALVAPWLTIDRTGLFLAAVISVGGALASLLAGGYLAEHKMDRGEYYPLLAFASAGAIMLAQSGDTLTLFLGLETMSLARQGAQQQPRDAVARLSLIHISEPTRPY